jgi:hypothetical protein
MKIENRLKINTLQDKNEAWSFQLFIFMMTRIGIQRSITIMAAHRSEGIEMFKIFPDNHGQNNPYRVLFGQGEWTCSIAILTGTHKGSMTGRREDNPTY